MKIDHEAAHRDAVRMLEDGVYPDFEDTKHICAAYMDLVPKASAEIRDHFRDLANECGKELQENGRSVYKMSDDPQTKMEGRIREWVGMVYAEIVEILFLEDRKKRMDDAISKISSLIDDAMRAEKDGK